MIPQSGTVTWSALTDTSQRFRPPVAICQVYKKPEECAPLVLMLGAPEFEQSVATVKYWERTYECSGVAYAQSTESFSPPLVCACLLEYGHGASQRSVLMDWRVGTYNLPPVTFARASLYALESHDVSKSYTFQASFAEGSFDTADVPTNTSIGTALAGPYPVPSGARAVELLAPGTLRIGSVNDLDVFTALQQITRSADGLQYEPPWSPVRVTAAPVSERKMPLAWTLLQDDTIGHVRWLLSL